MWLVAVVVRSFLMILLVITDRRRRLQQSHYYSNSVPVELLVLLLTVTSLQNTRRNFVCLFVCLLAFSGERDLRVFVSLSINHLSTLLCDVVVFSLLS